MQILLDCGAEINAQDIEGGTALQLASSYHNVQIVQMLLDRGAKVQIQGRSQVHPEMVQMLRDRGVKWDDDCAPLE